MQLWLTSLFIYFIGHFNSAFQKSNTERASHFSALLTCLQYLSELFVEGVDLITVLPCLSILWHGISSDASTPYLAIFLGSITCNLSFILIRYDMIYFLWKLEGWCPTNIWNWFNLLLVLTVNFWRLPSSYSLLSHFSHWKLIFSSFDMISRDLFSIYPGNVFFCWPNWSSL